MLRGFPEMLGQFIGSGVGVFHFGGCMAFDHQEWCPHGELQHEFLLDTLWRCWQSLQQLKALRKMTDRLDMRRALDSTLAGTLPVRNSLLTSLCPHIVLCQQLGLCLCDIWQLRFQYLRNALMVLLPRTPHERLIGHLLGEGMLKGVCRARGGVGLIEKLSSLKVPKVSMYGFLRHIGYRLQQRHGDVLADDRSGLEKTLSGSG